jgi:20S proteasome alpha/beta subunit
MLVPKPPKVRLPRAKRMTICIGMLASDGIVIAADSQESDSYFKRSQQKILPYIGGLQAGANPPPPTIACALTGAGLAGYLDAFFAYALRDIPMKATHVELEDFLANKVQTYHRRHIFPLAAAKDPPEIQALIGAYASFQTCMFVSYGSTLRRALHYAAVGAGAHFALSIMGELVGWRDLKQAELLAAYVIALTKERIEECGKYTAIVSLHNSTAVPGTMTEPSHLVPPLQPLTQVPGRKIQKWEESFAARWGPRQSKLVNELIEEELADDDAKQSAAQT